MIASDTGWPSPSIQKNGLIGHRGEVLIVKQFDRLLDLAFLAVYAKEQRECQREWLREQIIDAVKSIGFESEASLKSAKKDIVETTKELWKSLGFRSIRRLLTSDTCRGVAPHGRWMHSYLWHRSVQKRANHEVRIPVVDDVNDIGADGKKAVENLRHERDLLRASPSDTVARGGALAGMH